MKAFTKEDLKQPESLVDDFVYMCYCFNRTERQISAKGLEKLFPKTGKEMEAKYLRDMGMH